MNLIDATTLHALMTEPLQWPEGFRIVYDRARQAYGRGADHPDSLFDGEARAFLATVGCSPRELFDLVEDGSECGEPDFATSFEMASIRRDYFLQFQKGVPSSRVIDMDCLPPKPAAMGGIPWLPRIIEKARAKLRGEMPDELMYCCGGDRNFLRAVKMTAPQFLVLVRDAGEDTEVIVSAVRLSAAR